MEAFIYSPRHYRYFLAAENITEAAPTILDVGGYRSRRENLSEYFPGLTYLAANVDSAWYPGEEIDIPFDGSRLPYEDSSIEFVISVDTLEHVVPTARKALIQEMIRVAQKRVVVVVPISTNSVSYEEIYARNCVALGADVRPSISEHLELGLPTIHDIANFADGHQFTIRYRTEKDLYWAIQNAMLVNSSAFPDRARDLNQEMQRTMERLLIERTADVAPEQAYRAVLIVDK